MDFKKLNQEGLNDDLVMWSFEDLQNYLGKSKGRILKHVINNKNLVDTFNNELVFKGLVFVGGKGRRPWRFYKSDITKFIKENSKLIYEDTKKPT